MTCKATLLLLALTASSAAGTTTLQTYYEKSGYKATPRYAQTAEFCKRLDKASRWVRFTSFGRSPQGRDLPLLVVDKNETFVPKRVRAKGKVVLLIQAGIHAGEIDGKDAGLMLIRDIITRPAYAPMLDHVVILFIPIFNVDGHERFGPYSRINQNGPEEMGWRTTAANLNLNRDYLKADTPEMRAWLELFQEWKPDFFIDCHVTDGADYQYVLTYAMDVFGNMTPNLTEWTREKYLAPVKQSLLDAGIEMFPYVGLIQPPDPTKGMRSWVATPRFSEGYTSLQNRPGLLVETHMLKDYKTRVTATYQLLKETVLLLNREYVGLRSAVKEADEYVADEAFRRKPFALTFKADPDGRMIDFKGTGFTVEESEVSGAKWYRFDGGPETFRIEYLDKQRPVRTIALPEAYIIPPEWRDVIDRLDLHGVELKRTKDAQTIRVESYRFDNPNWRDKPFEGRVTMTFDVEAIEEERTYPAGSVIVDMNQPLAQVAAHILEPRAPDSFVMWGFFNAIFERKEYAEAYVMEKMARKMLAENPALKREFEEKKSNDEEFANDPRAILDWFYRRTPYWDKRINVYPVGRILDRKAVDSIHT